MTSLRESIRGANRLARMRSGQEVPEYVEIPSMSGVRVWMVPLTEGEAQAGVIRAAMINVPDNAAGLQARNRAAIESDVFHSIREPGNIDKRVFESIEDMTAADGLTSTDIDLLADNLAALMDYASPAIDGITDEKLDELKKAFGETDWSALTGRQWAVLKLACQALFPEILMVRSLGSTSTESSITKNENGEST